MAMRQVEEHKSRGASRLLDGGSATGEEGDGEEEKIAGNEADAESRVTIQHTKSDDEEMRTINNGDEEAEQPRAIEEEKKRPEPKPDKDLHEFFFDGRKFYVRLNQFVRNQ